MAEYRSPRRGEELAPGASLSERFSGDDYSAGGDEAGVAGDGQSRVVVDDVEDFHVVSSVTLWL
jgi:hypothetical protein